MFVILGAAGKVGFSTASALRAAGLPVRAVLRDAARADKLRAIGCDVALADLQDPAALRQAFAGAQAVQIILPPPLRAEDARAEMRRMTANMAEAIARAGPERVLAISDYGAHVDEDIGMPTVFRHFEDRLRELAMPKVFLRSAEHMEGWARSIPTAIATGILPSLHHPVERTFAAVSTGDVGRIAADFLRRPSAADVERIVHAEGPRRYSAADVASALSQLLGRTITAQAVPREHWQEALERAVSASTAGLLVDLYDAHNKGGLIDIEPQGEVCYGTTELVEALRPFVPA